VTDDVTWLLVGLLLWLASAVVLAPCVGRHLAARNGVEYVDYVEYVDP